MSALSKKYNNFLAPEAVIKINGQKLSEKHIYFSSLEVDKSYDSADTFSFTISDAINLEFEPKHKGLFSLGNQVEIYIGYAQNSDKESNLLFVGLITNVNWNFEQGNYLDISVEGEDFSFLLMKHKHKGSFKEKSSSDIVQTLVDTYYKNFLSKTKIDTTKIVHDKYEHKETSDYLFMQKLAKDIDYEFFIDKRKLVFQSSPKKQTSTLTLHYGQEILGFKPELNIGKEVSKVRVVSLLISSDKKQIIGEAELKREKDTCSGNDIGIKTLQRKLESVTYEIRKPVHSIEEAKKEAEALLQKFSLNYLKAEIKSIGIPELKPGITISLKGLGNRFSCSYYVEKVVHRISDQGYESTISVRGGSNAFTISTSEGK